MMNNLKRLLSVVLVLSFVLITAVPASAASTSGYMVTADNTLYRIAEEVVETTRFVYTLDKSANTLKTEAYDESGNKLSTKLVDLNEILASSEYAYPTDDVAVASTGYYQHTFANYEYDQLTTTKYQLRNKNSYAIRYTTNNLEAINNYIEAVDILNAAELAVIASGGATVLWAVLTYLSGGLTAGEAALAAGAAAVEVTALSLAIDNCQRVWRLYVDV